MTTTTKRAARVLTAQERARRLMNIRLFWEGRYAQCREAQSPEMFLRLTLERAKAAAKDAAKIAAQRGDRDPSAALLALGAAIHEWAFAQEERNAQ